MATHEALTRASWLRVKDVVVLLNDRGFDVSEQSIYRWISKGCYGRYLRCCTVGGKKYVSRADLDEFLASGADVPRSSERPQRRSPAISSVLGGEPKGGDGAEVGTRSRYPDPSSVDAYLDSKGFLQDGSSMRLLLAKPYGCEGFHAATDWEQSGAADGDSGQSQKVGFPRPAEIHSFPVNGESGMN